MELAVRLLVVVAVVAVAAAVGLWRRRTDGRITTDLDDRLTADELAAVGLGERDGQMRALLLSAPGCAPCVTVKRVLGEVADGRPGFAWVEIDAGEHLELTRRHRILRVPTLLVVDHDGRIVGRADGVPRSDDLTEVLDGDARVDAA